MMRIIIKVFLIVLSLNATAKSITIKEYSNLFKNYHGCFILYNLNENKVISKYNPYNRCNQRISPNSTFKIPLSLMAFNQNIINQSTVFKWDGRKSEIPEHNKDHNPAGWLQNSVLWVSQVLTPKLGYARINHYLAGFNYGNKDFSGDPSKHNGLTHAWLSSSLKISAQEQLDFLKAMLTDELPIDNKALEYTKQNLYLGTLKNGAKVYGKTGSGRNGRNERESYTSKLRDGWFVGFIEQGKERYIFVSNITDKAFPAQNDKEYGGRIVKPISLKLLNEYFS